MQCFGHYKPVLVDVTDSGALKELQQPPPTMLKGYLNNDNYNIEHISEKVLLPVQVEKCKLWLEHLKTIVEKRCYCNKKVKEKKLVCQTLV